MLFRLLEHMRDSQKRLQVPHRGLVLDNQDPERLGRIKVQIDELFPTDVTADVLPWVYPLSSAMLGGGTDASAFSVPAVGNEVVVMFPFDDVYTGFYTGYWQSASTHAGRFNQDYPDSYGFTDPSGVEFKINRTRQEVVLKHPSDTRVSISSDGSVTFSSKATITFQSKNGSAKVSINGDTGEITIDSPDVHKILADLEIDNTSVTENTGAKEQNIDGDKASVIGGGKSEQIGGSASRAVVGNDNDSVGGDQNTVVGGSSSAVYGTGRQERVATGNYDVETAVGSVTLQSTLAKLNLPATGVAELDGALVQIAGGDQATLLGQDAVQWLMEHTHPTGTGPSAPPREASEAVNLLSKKTFNS